MSKSYKIEGDNFIITEKIPLLQESYDALDEMIGLIPSLVGVVHVSNSGNDDRYTIHYLVDLGYKGTQDIGMEVIEIETKEEFDNLCKEIPLSVVYFSTGDGEEISRFDCLCGKGGCAECYATSNKKIQDSLDEKNKVIPTEPVA